MSSDPSRHRERRRRHRRLREAGRSAPAKFWLFVRIALFYAGLLLLWQLLYEREDLVAVPLPVAARGLGRAAPLHRQRPPAGTPMQASDAADG